MTDPDMGTWSYEYDTNGNLKRQTDARNNTICFYYDTLNRLTNKYDQTGTPCPSPTPAPNPNVTYTYDDTTGGNRGVGRRTRMDYGTGNNTTWTYDARGRVTKGVYTISGAPSTSYMMQYTYNSLDQIITVTYPDNDVATQVYNDRGMAVSLESTLTDLVPDTHYNLYGMLNTLTLGNSLTTTYWYSSPTHPYRLAGITTAGPQGEHLQDLDYFYDNVDNILTIDDASVTGGLDESQNFAYDAFHRMTHAYTSVSSFRSYDYTYGYSGIGNITSLNSLAYFYDGTQPHAVRSVRGMGGQSQPLTVHACGYWGNNGWPSMDVRVNGIYVLQRQTVNVSCTIPNQWGTYTVNATLTGNDLIEVVYTNDSGARDLYVKDVQLPGGRAVYPAAGETVYDLGNGSFALDGRDVVRGQNRMMSSGALRFVVGPSAYAAGYDENGNQTSRVLDGRAWLQGYDGENRLAVVTDTVTMAVTRFVYDGDGKRVMQIAPDGSKTVYIGQWYEERQSVSKGR
ncbi:MAG: hypothetical protein C4310_14580, partial [Chloroflexota bacterium]